MEGPVAEVTPSKMLELDSQLGLQTTEVLADQGRSMEHGATAWHISISITGRSIGKTEIILSVAQERANSDTTAMFRR